VADAVVDCGITRDGLVQQRRRWAATDAHAAALVVPGISEHSGRYDHVGRALSAAGIDVIAIDARGFGASGGPRAAVQRFGEYLDDVQDQLHQIAALGLPVALFGHSMGGLVALSYALEHRSPRPDVLVLSAPALGAEIPAVLRALVPVMARLAPRVLVPSPISGDMLSTDPTVGAAYRADPLIVTGTTASLGRALLGQMRWVNRHLAPPGMPTLVLHGGDDPLVPPAFTAPLAALAGVERRVLPGLRHEVCNEPSHPATLASIAAWIDAHLDAHVDAAAPGPRDR
jgi:alpha-beta hydrolase superfamily lysophospholipase